MLKTLDFIALFSYCLLIYWLSDQAHLPTPMWFTNQDKIHHGGAYFIMAIFAWRYFKHLLDRPALLALVSFGFCSLYGMSDEWHQSFIAGRESDLLDWLADSCGAGIAVLVLYHPHRNKRNTFLSPQ